MFQSEDLVAKLGSPRAAGPQLIGTREASGLLGIDRGTVLKWVHQNRLPACVIELGKVRRYKFKRTDVLHFGRERAAALKRKKRHQEFQRMRVFGRGNSARFEKRLSRLQSPRRGRARTQTPVTTVAQQNVAKLLAWPAPATGGNRVQITTPR